MTERAYVNTQDPVICQALVKLAKEHGWEGSMLDDPSYPVDFPLFTFTADDTIAGNTAQAAFALRLTLEQAIKRIKKGAINKRRLDDIGGQDTFVTRGELTVGGIVVPFSTVEDTYRTMLKLRGDNE